MGIKNLEKIFKKENMLIIILAGILIFVVSIPVSPKEKETDKLEKTEESIQNSLRYSNDQMSYCLLMERRLEKLFRYMEGVGENRVMLTISCSEEKIVEKDAPVIRNTVTEKDGSGGSRSTNESEYQYETIYELDENGKKMPYVVKKMEPVIEGVTVVAEGGGNPIVQKNISDALIALFHIDAHKIKVVKMK